MNKAQRIRQLEAEREQLFALLDKAISLIASPQDRLEIEAALEMVGQE